MSSLEPTSEFMFLFRGTDFDKDLSPEKLQTVMDRFRHWVNDLTVQGTMTSGQPLEASGTLLVHRNGRTVADGPYAESKEAVGGYFLIQARDLEAAIEIAKGHPLLEYGLTVEVRPVAHLCPAMEKIGMEMAVSQG